jgi:tetratricopeptide (TPR) repeat protein
MRLPYNFGMLKLRSFIPVLIIAAGLLAYHNSFHGPFIFDDATSIVDNPHIRHLWPMWQPLTSPHQGGITVEGRPILSLSLAINYAINGLRVEGYHAVNLAIHIAAGLVLFGVVRRTLLQPPLRQRFGTAAVPLGLLIAVIWVVHPLQTESVTYIVQRAESMMGLFYLLTLYGFIRGVESPGSGSLPVILSAAQRSRRISVVSRRCPTWFLLSVTACFMGMACKEVMVSAPLIVLLYDRAFIAGSFRDAWRRRRALYLWLGATWICLVCVILSAERFGTTSAIAKYKGISWWAYLLTEPGVILYYLRLCVWPQPLCFDYFGWPVPGAWTTILPSAAGMVVLLGATVWAWRTKSIPSGLGPAWGFLGAWIFLILGPTSSLIPMDSPAYEHHMYLPLAAVVAAMVLGGVALGNRVFNRQQGVALGCVAGGAVVVLFASMTIQRNRDYNSALTIWQDTAEKRPDNPRAQDNLGGVLLRAGNVSQAIACFEQALRIKPDDADAHSNLGNALCQTGEVREAINHCEQAIRLQPDHAGAHNNLGLALANAGRVKDAIGQYEVALRINPGFAEARSNLASALLGLGKVQEAIGEYERALQINPDFAAVHSNLGNALLRSGNVRRAIEHCQRALQLMPDYAEAHSNLGRALVQLGRLQEAISQYDQALRIKPDDAGAHFNLGNALCQAGQVPEAIGHYEQALRIKPDYADARINLGVALMGQGRLQQAISQYEQALQIKPDSVEAHFNLGNAMRQAGRLPEAISYYEQALRIRPDYAEAHGNLGNALVQAGRVPEAIEHWQQALQINPDLAETHYNLGATLEKLGRRQEAIQHYEQALHIKPDFVQARNALARARAVQ